jgi:phosphoribosylaminoimidazole-succinocarboxamide synthase
MFLVYQLVEMMESRLTGEQAEQILQIVCDTLPAPSAARAADEPAPTSHYARDQPAASRGARQNQIQLEIASVKNSKVFLMDEVGGDGGDAPSADE